MSAEYYGDFFIKGAYIVDKLKIIENTTNSEIIENSANSVTAETTISYCPNCGYPLYEYPMSQEVENYWIGDKQYCSVCHRVIGGNDPSVPQQE